MHPRTPGHEPNLRTTIVGDLISELDLLRDPGRDGPIESQSASLPIFPQDKGEPFGDCDVLQTCKFCC